MGNKLQKPQETNVVEEHEQKEEVVSSFTCEICIEPMLSNKKFENASLCTHPFCLDCISKYVEVKVEGFIGNIKCPGTSCKHPLDPLSCRSIISKPVFDKWCDLLCDSVVSGVERCYCPYRDCSALVLNECKDKLKKIKCPNCKKNLCYVCKIPWHAGYQCNESGQLRDRNDVLIGELIEEKKWTRCYNCGHSVERVSGCRDVKCKCGVRFCHQCGGRFHLGPCKHKCCGDAFCMLLFFIILMVFCYLFYHQVNLLSPSV
ncbi:E3 ubiquitin-protein ligase RSL1 [Ricinus communis]|uniref:E3 ubiquitin-protein ligase RSL1 n=1 Tax=Ricinus communis TaxID=3988 RepID=UPI000772A9BB|nr:E3 ubiquitin-protein ligase RSL1 [Ricinus communis]XP_015581566.1 E3 ubiquitin-protein ligase RSL1 [Ricinus communis]XP_015581567.1 E3 ubiquitin-protein ligase RSL1 [Ricinus communis]XP_015581568.1 E3 ubiquitin-protein ligase RSL1 [Ricinus communis]XP_015581572.1 E3 ubiquitin-protein ligase RSL1 [Ricinus communis]XP_015581573.1 E3 ubiquitin-protein ligase RSL1 [Ricinus communis]XP_015581574.1 E3 ubiquitin-protein ligase RSL1 [Ricinus communis]XP_048234594.1 E3 ubiquitin-protein ligase RSL|eukprot:XP_015581564.1 probable E3 ubiquitin-protein ligase RNF217 isoform X1 [Ricinus communis]